MSTRVMTTWSLKSFLELQNERNTKNSAIYHFHIDHNANCFPLRTLNIHSPVVVSVTMLIINIYKSRAVAP